MVLYVVIGAVVIIVKSKVSHNVTHDVVLSTVIHPIASVILC